MFDILSSERFDNIIKIAVPQASPLQLIFPQLIYLRICMQYLGWGQTRKKDYSIAIFSNLCLILSDCTIVLYNIIDRYHDCWMGSGRNHRETDEDIVRLAISVQGVVFCKADRKFWLDPELVSIATTRSLVPSGESVWRNDPGFYTRMRRMPVKTIYDNNLANTFRNMLESYKTNRCNIRTNSDVVI